MEQPVEIFKQWFGLSQACQPGLVDKKDWVLLFVQPSQEAQVLVATTVPVYHTGGGGAKYITCSDRLAPSPPPPPSSKINK